MTTLAMVSILLGAALGLRFKVLTLLPAIGLAMAVILVGGAAFGYSLSHLALSSVIMIVVLQVGYLAGVVARQLLPRMRGSRRPAAWPRPARNLT